MHMMHRNRQVIVMFPGSKKMSTDNIRNLVSGAFIVDKPVGITSHDVVQIIRRGTGIRRVGHTGTLDPRASGVLVILLGPSVRLSEFISASDKRYQATIHLGSSTETYDAESLPTEETEVDISEEEFSELLKGYIGEIEQVPPPYSAVKVDGKKAYELARKGEEVELPPRIINVYGLDVLEWALPEVVIDAHCSSGTYIRSLAHDLGEELGVGAHLVGLRRTMSGRFSMRDSISLRRLKEAFDTGEWAQYLIPASEALGDWYTVTLEDDQMNKVRNGHRIPAADDAPEMARAISEQGDLVAILALVEETKEWQPRKVFMS